MLQDSFFSIDLLEQDHRGDQLPDAGNHIFSIVISKNNKNVSK